MHSPKRIATETFDFDGDLFEAMKVADSFDTIELTMMQKFMFALRIWKLSE